MNRYFGTGTHGMGQLSALEYFAAPSKEPSCASFSILNTSFQCGTFGTWIITSVLIPLPSSGLEINSFLKGRQLLSDTFFTAPLTNPLNLQQLTCDVL